MMHHWFPLADVPRSVASSTAHFLHCDFIMSPLKSNSNDNNSFGSNFFECRSFKDAHQKNEALVRS